MKHTRLRLAAQLPLLLLILVGFTFQARALDQQAVAQTVDQPHIELQAFHFITPDEGWLLIDQRLFWTDNSAQTWREITPDNLKQYTIQTAAFADVKHGWLALTMLDAAGSVRYALARTRDGGRSWQIDSLDLFKSGDIDALFDAVYLNFIDSQTGWLVIKQATSSNFSVGTLFRTDDGGDTWARLAMPTGEPVSFVTREMGWTAGGATGAELYQTQDGGRTWQSRSAALKSANPDQSRAYRLPVFQDAQRGVLPVITTDERGSSIEFYATSDGGQTWSPSAVTTIRASAEGIDDLDWVTSTSGWARRTSGQCESSQSVVQCWRETQLVKTSDGGQTWAIMKLPSTVTASGALRESFSVSPAVLAAPNSLGDRTLVFAGHGFDKCEIATASQLQTWLNASPYRAVNLYIGGATRSCGNTALSSSLLNQLSQQGWKFIPTWVGPQSMCWSHPTSWHISNDPAVAYQQGVDNANAAVNVAFNLGLTLADKSGTVIYYDLEAYNTGNAACHTAAMSFISGWTSQMHALGNQAGFYGYGPAINASASIANVPDVIWPASWYYNSGDPRGVYNPNANVWNVYGLSNNLWSNHQRIRQYTGGHSETWGGVGLTIDSDVLDGVVASLTNDNTPPTTSSSLAGTLGYDNWYTTAVQVTLTATDNNGGAGVKLIQYKIDSGGWQTYAAPFSVTADGSHTLTYQAQDNAGNWEMAQTISFKIDQLPPLNPGSIDPGCPIGNNVWQSTCADPNFTWSGASDGNGSGIKDYRYYWGPHPNGAPITYTSVTSYDPPPVSGPVAAQYLLIATRDNLNHESQASMVFGFLYDAGAPTVTVQINHGAATANQVNVMLNLSASDTGSGVSDMRLSTNGVEWGDWQPLTTELPWTLHALNRRTASVYAQVRDRAGNLSGVATASIYLDLYPIAPHSASYRLCQNVTNAGGSTRITSTNYLLASAIGQPSASGANAMTSSSFNGQSGFLANLTACLPITYTATTNYTLTQSVIASAGNVRGSASYRLGDTAGQAAASDAAVFSSTTYRMSSGFWAAITTTIPITTIPPTPVPTHTPTPMPTPGPTATPQPTSFGVTINDGALYTNNPQVTIRAWGPNVVQTMLSNDGGFLNAPWQTYQLTHTWVLSTYGHLSMPYYVFVRFRDGGNTEYGTYFDDIIYDPVAPQGSVSILGGNAQTVTLWLEASDDYSGVADVRVSANPAEITSADWQPYAATLNWTMTGDLVYVQYRDRAGNISPLYGSDGAVYNPNTKKVYLPLILK